MIQEAASSVSIRDFWTVAGVSPEVEVVKERYAKGGTGLQLWDHEGPLLTATHWLPGIPEGCVAVKDYEENEGCLAQLIAKGVLGRPERFQNGYPICRVLF